MRFLLLTFLSFALVSCNQDSSSSSKKNGNDGNDPQEEVAPEVLERERQEYATDVTHTDLLDVAVDVPVEVTGSKIIFKNSVSKTETGSHSSCSINATAGDAYDYTINGNKLSITTQSGEKFDLVRKFGSANSLVGSWGGEVMSGDQTIQRRMTFVSEDRMVLRVHCEG